MTGYCLKQSCRGVVVSRAVEKEKEGKKEMDSLGRGIVGVGIALSRRCSIT